MEKAFSGIIIPALSLLGLGVAFGAGLALAAKKFRVSTDPRLQEILEKLPGSNCGSCGAPGGCSGFAEGLLKGKFSVARCVLIKQENREEVAKILGVEAKVKVRTCAVLYCNGGDKRAKDKFSYQGIKDCIAASQVMSGPKACLYGCIGFGTCASACVFGAITMDKEGLPVVSEERCVACGRCVEACPKKLFTLVPVENKVYVACNSQDTGRDTKAVCQVGCIACKLCEKACGFDAIHVIGNLAVIDYNKCTSCGECVKVCPAKTIRGKKHGQTRGQIIKPGSEL
jgi:Na+-translocating ferredoxin:NAD+ oxidoreductase RNF subunit RnfB